MTKKTSNQPQNQKAKKTVAEMVKLVDEESKKNSKTSSPAKLLSLMKVIIKEHGVGVIESDDVKACIVGEGKWFSKMAVLSVSYAGLRKQAAKLGKSFPKFSDVLVTHRGKAGQGFQASDFDM
jgi:hypothetical protein